LAELDTRFTSLQKALDGLKNATGGSSLSAAVSDPAVARANIAAGALEGVYTLDVIALGSHTNTLSAATLPAVKDPSTQNISSSSAFTLTVDGTTYALTPASTSLTDLVNAINDSAAGVRATIVNFGTNAAPNYRLSVQSAKLGSVSIQLNDGSADLLTALSTGAPAEYQINGQPATPLTSDSRTLSLSPGLTIDLLKVGTTEVSVTRTPGSVRDSLTALVTAFNAAVDEVDKHRGENEGPLAGQSLTYSLARSLREITSFSSGNSLLPDLSALGLTFTKQGRLEFDQTTFTAAASADFNGVLNFLGTATTGFLGAAQTAMKGLEDTTDGELQMAIKSVKFQIVDQDRRIADNQSRISLMRDTMLARMAAADALIAQMEQSVTLLNGLFQAQLNSKN
jgi:flagellar hook-associated protein 2